MQQHAMQTSDSLAARTESSTPSSHGTAGEHAHSRNSAEQAPSSSPAGFLKGSGFVLALLGSALVASSKLPAEVQALASKLSSHGVHGGTLLVGGAVLFGMGMAVRSIVATLRSLCSKSESDASLVIDQLATEVARVHSSVGQASAQLESISTTQQVLLEHASTPSAPAETAPSQDAIFRLAASLDQMNAHMEGRFQAMTTELDAQVQTLAASMERVRGAILALPRSSASSAHARVSGHASQAAPRAQRSSSAERAQEEFDVQVDLERAARSAESDEFFETLEDLDGIVGGSQAASHDPRPALPNRPATHAHPSSEDLDALLPDEHLDRSLGAHRRHQDDRQ
jgi:hypothetical protein